MRRIRRKLAIGILALFLLALAWYAWTVRPASRWRTENPERTAFMEQRVREARERGEALEIDYRWVPLDEISRHLPRAVVAAEDMRFYRHGGVDWAAIGEECRYGGDERFGWSDPGDLKALAEAFTYCWSHRGELRGRSTLTQQLAKNLFLSPDRTAGRKLQEFLLARRMEAVMSKERILELYLNVVEFGPGVFGAEAASRRYFGKPAKRLTREEAITLAATLPAPLTANPGHNAGKLEWRKRDIRQRMR